MSMATPPAIRVFRIPFFVDPQQLSAVACLQMSDTGLYLNWKPSHADGDEEEEVDEADDDDEELDPEMQENAFWESIVDQAPDYAGKTNSIALFVLCYTGTYV